MTKEYDEIDALLFVTGMVRSGTTLISRAIHAHSNIVCAPDPFMGFFKSLRNDYLHRVLGRTIEDPDMPLTDFFCDEVEPLKLYRNASFNERTSLSSAALEKEIVRFARNNAESVIPELKISGGTYAEIFSGLLTALKHTYPKKDTRWVGFKQTWCELFGGFLLNTWSNAQCIHIIRDPRAVISSWKKTGDLSHDYPFLMMIRHWRKSVALAFYYATRYRNYHIIQYENFVTDPEKILRDLCGFLRLGFDPCMLDVSSFKNGKNSRWKSNDSYQKHAEFISSDLIDRWKERLSEEERLLIETLCAPEMDRLGYKRRTDIDTPSSFLSLFKTIGRGISNDDDWSRKYRNQYEMNPDNFSKELVRWSIYKKYREHPEHYDKRLMRMYFPDPSLISGSIETVPD